MKIQAITRNSTPRNTTPGLIIAIALLSAPGTTISAPAVIELGEAAVAPTDLGSSTASVDSPDTYITPPGNPATPTSIADGITPSTASLNPSTPAGSVTPVIPVQNQSFYAGSQLNSNIQSNSVVLK